MNLFLKKNYITLIYIVVLSITILSIYFGFRHSIYNQDYHHLFFILSALIDFDNGYKLFKDIFLQYGPGQIIFFKSISYFIDLNIVTLSQITTLVYSLNILLLFFLFKKTSNIESAFSLVIIIFLIHPFSILPWPDYLSGISLTLFFLFFLNNNSKYNLILSAFFLFLAIFFRSTYILNITFSILIYFFLFRYHKEKNILKNLFLTFIFLIFIFFLVLSYFNVVSNWFNQSIMFITSYAEETKHLELYEKVTSYVGEYGFIVLKIFYYAIRSTLNLFNISNFENIIFVFFIIINFIYLFQTLKNRMKVSDYEKKIVFLSILGLSGFVQSLMLMEVFRNINATIGIFLVGLFFFNKKINFDINNHKKKIYALVIIYGLILLKNFPNVIYDDRNYTYLDNHYFKNKRILPEIKKYYSELNNFICKDENIIIANISWDYAIPYICNKKNLKNNYSHAIRFLKKINKNEHKRIFIDADLKNNEYIFTDMLIENPKLKLIRKFESPLTPKDWYHDINVYKLK